MGGDARSRSDWLLENVEFGSAMYFTPVLIAFHLVGCEDWHDNMTGLHFAITVPSQFRHTVITQKGFFFICAQPTGRHYDSCTKRTWWSGMWCRWTTAHRFNRWQDWLLPKQRRDEEEEVTMIISSRFASAGNLLLWVAFPLIPVTIFPSEN